MFGFNSVASTGEFPGFVNPMEPERGESDLVILTQDTSHN
jgi:hypothetical protein